MSFEASIQRTGKVKMSELTWTHPPQFRPFLRSPRILEPINHVVYIQRFSASPGLQTVQFLHILLDLEHTDKSEIDHLPR